MNKKSLYMAIIFFCLVCITGCDTSNKHLNRMSELEENIENPTTIEELKAAIKAYEKQVQEIIGMQMKTGVWYKMLGSRYIDNQMYGLALESFQKAIEYYPSNQNLFYYVGVCAGYVANAALDYNATGKTESARYLALAESAYIRAIELNPRYASALYGLSVLYVFELNENAKAIPYLERVLEIEKSNFDAMFVLARAYYVVGEYENAIDLYDRIIAGTKSKQKKADAESNKKLVVDAFRG